MERTAQVVVSAAAGDGTVYIWEPTSLTVLAQFQDNKTAPGQSLASYAAGLIAIQDKKTLLHYYKYGSSIGTPDKKSTTVSRLKCVTSWRHLLLGGFSTGEIRLWDSHTGEELAVFPAHSAAVTSLALSEAGILTGGEDGIVQEFRLSDVYLGQTAPQYTYSHHIMTVTNVLISGRKRFTTSLDHCFGEVENGVLVGKQDCGSALNCVEVGSREDTVFVGGVDGSVFRMGRDRAQWKWQERPVTALALLTNETILLVAAESVFLLSAVSGDRLKAFKMHKGPVSCMILIDRPAALLSLSDGQEPIHPLAKGPDPAIRHPVILQRGAVSDENEGNPEEENRPKIEEDEKEKLKAMNQWIYGVWVDGWL